jgi:hypothetical protein
MLQDIRTGKSIENKNKHGEIGLYQTKNLTTMKQSRLRRHIWNGKIISKYTSIKF